MAGNHRGGDALSPSLRDRVANEMTLFTQALDAAMTNPSPEILDNVREAADRLMRATGRVLIEVARLRDRGDF